MDSSVLLRPENVYNDARGTREIPLNFNVTLWTLLLSLPKQP